MSAEVAAKKGTRLAFIDGLRGLASLAVVVYHLHGAWELEQLRGLLPAFVNAIASHGYLGVEVFFVLSGRVMAQSLAGSNITPRFVGQFALRRSMRLDPPYWATIALAIVLAAIARHLPHSSETELPSAVGVLAHLFYLQGILGYPHVLAAFWTLCIEIQFYLVFAMLLGVAQRLPTTRARALIGAFAIPGLVSLAYLFGATSAGGNTTFLPFFYAFLLGALAAWVGTGEVPVRAFAAFVVPCTVAIFVTSGDAWAPAVAVVTAVGLVVSERRGLMSRWLAQPFWQFLGRISYSLYLIHMIAGLRMVSLFSKLVGTSLVSQAASFVLGLLASLVAAAVLFRFVEQPAVNWSRWLKTWFERPRPHMAPEAQS